MKRTFAQAIIMIALTLTTTLQAQVTIGSGEHPNAGTLLDLKMAGGNTSKGLMLPRVKLEQEDKLHPMLAVGYDPLENDKHVGLVVYNVNIAGDMCPGLYVWGATQWVRLSTTLCIPLTGLALDLTSQNKNLIISDNFTAQLIFTPADAINKKVIWTTTPTSPSFVIISTTGRVLASRVGVATITATSESGGHVASTTVNVEDMTIALDKTNLQMLTGDQETVTTTVGPTWAPIQTYTWASADNTKVTVSATGLVEAKADTGGATVVLTAKTDKRNKTATVNVEVADLVVDITDASPIRMIAAEKKTLATTVTPTWAPNKGLTWLSTNDYVAEVATTGEITAKNTGTAYITAKSSAKTTVFDQIAVEVASMAVAIDKTGPINMLTGETTTFTASVTPTWAANKAVNWITSNGAVATVDANGKVTAIGPGTANITATTVVGGATSSITVKVENLFIKLDRETLGLYKGRTSTITSTIIPAWAAAKYKDKVEWTISDASAATIVPSADKDKCNVTATAVNALAVPADVIVKIAGTNASDTLKLLAYNRVIIKFSSMISLFEGSVHTLTPTITPDPVLNGFHLEYTSDDPTMVTVGLTTGEVSAIAATTAPFSLTSLSITAKMGTQTLAQGSGSHNNPGVRIMKPYSVTNPPKDGDGNTYNFKKIGNTYWLTQNSYTTKSYSGGQLNVNYPTRINPAIDGQEAYSVPSKAALASGTVIYGEHATESSVRNKTVAKKVFAQTFGLLYNEKAISGAIFACPAMNTPLYGDVNWGSPDETAIKELAAAYGYPTEPDIVGDKKIYRGVGEVMRANNNYYVGMDHQGMIQTGAKWGVNDQPGKAGLSGLNFSPGGYAYDWSFPVSPIITAWDFRGVAYFYGGWGKVWSFNSMNGDLTLTPLTSNQQEYNYYPIRCVFREQRP